MNATIQRFNALVEEFDESTGFNFDRETDLDVIILAASVWPSCRRTLAHDLALIDVGELRPAAKAGERFACDFDRAFDSLTGEPRDAGRDDWRANR